MFVQVRPFTADGFGSLFQARERVLRARRLVERLECVARIQLPIDAARTGPTTGSTIATKTGFPTSWRSEAGRSAIAIKTARRTCAKIRCSRIAMTTVCGTLAISGMAQARSIDADFVQDVHSRSSRGTVRGLHYQINHAQGKLIRVIRGEAFDVAVDIRKSSPTFGQWVGEILSEGNRKLMWVPPGFAHGFMVLSEFADFEYRMTDYHAPEHNRSIRWDDPDIGIVWPSVSGEAPLTSDADSDGSSFKNAEVYA